MVETSYAAVWILTLLLYLILIIIFSQTTCFVKRSCLKRLRRSNDGQRPVIAYNQFQRTTKRAAFIIHVGFLEVCAGLVVVMEATAVKFNIVRNQPEKEPCVGYHQCVGQLHYISCAVVSCLFISIVRCLAQRYVLGRLPKSDVVSMTRVYLVPATCFVTVLCVWSWFRLYGDREKKQSDGMIVCCQATQTFPLNSFLLILLPIFWNAVVDYLEYRKETSGPQTSPCPDSLKTGDSACSKLQTHLTSEVVFCHDHPIHTLSKFTNSISGNHMEIGNNNLALSTYTALPPRDSKTSERVQFTDKTAVPSVFDSLLEFLNMYSRIYLALIIHLAAIIGVYAFVTNCHAHSGLEEFTSVVFMTILVVAGILRAMQIAVAEATENSRYGLKIEEKVVQLDV